jgi:hypothetical protein
MNAETWETVLVVGLVVNAIIGLGYRVYRRTKGGPIADVWGQAILAVLLVAIASGIALGADSLRWVALVYAAVFTFLAMPVWVLGVLLPLRPRAIDYSFTITYWALLIAIGIAALFA